MNECRFRENLREELNYQGITVKTLSEKTGISKRTLENYLSSKGTLPPVDYACRIADFLGVSVESLAYGEAFQKRKSEILKKTKFLFSDIQRLSEENQRLVFCMIHEAAKR